MADSGDGDWPAANTLADAALLVLNTADPMDKARIGEDAATRWLQGSISLPYPHDRHPTVPDRPARLPTVKLVPSHLMPKLGKGGSLHSRQAILHSLVHTESWAIDLSWDIIARFGRRESMPREFFTDFVRVAQDEGRHFTLLVARLQELGSYYGSFSAHDGLWDSAMKTSEDLLARLAVEHCVHEARGLDVLPTIISRFRKGGDESTAELLERVVYPEEITHCAAGVKWFTYLCLRKPSRHQILLPGCIRPQDTIHEGELSKQQQVGHQDNDDDDDETIDDGELSKQPQVGHQDDNGGSGRDDDDDDDNSIECLEDAFRCLEAVGNVDHGAVIQTFHATVRRYFRGPLKPPFNAQARKTAGFGPEWYEPLAMKEVKMPS